MHAIALVVRLEAGQWCAMITTASRRALLASSLVALWACSTPKGVFEGKRGPIQAKLDAVAALAKPGGAPAKAATPSPSGTPAPYFGSFLDAKTNAVILTREEAADPVAARESEIDLSTDSGCLKNAASFLKLGRAPEGVRWKADAAESCVGMILRLRYVLILQGASASLPVKTGDKTFSPGHYSATAELFDLELGSTGKKVAVAAQNDTKVTTNWDVSGLKVNLKARAEDELRKGLVAAVPGVVFSK